MYSFEVPQDPPLLAAVAIVAIRHGQLDHMLRLAIKSITQVTIREVLDATSRLGSNDLRNRARKLARQRLGEGPALIRFEALLERSKRATTPRNELLHSVWAFDTDRNPVIKDDDHAWVEPPSIEKLESVADDLAEIAYDLNEARLNGFLREALELAGPISRDRQ